MGDGQAGEEAETTDSHDEQLAIFYAMQKAAGIDYDEEGYFMKEDLDRFIKTLAAKPENAGMSFDWLLSEAHRRVMSIRSVVAPTKRK